MRYRAAVLASLVAGLLLMPACAPKTKMVSSWKSPDFRSGSVKKVFVLGVAADSSLRRFYEDSFVASIEKSGITAVPGYTSIPDPRTLDREALEKKFRAEGYTHVLATRIVDQKTIETYVPPQVTTVGVAAPGYYGSWYGYYSVGYTTVVSPGYVVRDEVYSLETNLWDVASGERVWTGLSQTWVGESPEANLKAVISRVGYELRAMKIL